MPVNAHPEYLDAEKQFHQAGTDDEKLAALEEMIKWVPKHKSAENLRKNIRTRYKKLKAESTRKKKRSGKKGIKKESLQAVMVGLTNSGKSSLLRALTNAYPKIASYGFTTTEPELGTLTYQGINIQLVDIPPIASEHFDKGIVNNADVLLIVVEKIHEIKEILKNLKETKSKRIIIFNKIDVHNKDTKRKIKETLRTKKYNFVITSTMDNEGIEELKEKIFNSFGVLRIFTKHPGKKDKLGNIPIIMLPKSTVQDVAEKILHGYSKKVKFAKITGPSSKFANQKVGLKHKVKDNDTVEFYTK